MMSRMKVWSKRCAGISLKSVKPVKEKPVKAEDASIQTSFAEAVPA
jgi:hypothetical protein